MPEVRRIEAVESKAEHPLELGARLEKGGIRFSMTVPWEEKAAVLLYRAGEQEPAAEIPFPEKPVLGNIHTVKIAGFSWKEYEYNFKINDTAVLDPYARKICGREKFGVRDTENGALRCGFSFGDYDWQGDEAPAIPYEDAVMYHLHIRNFTKNRKSGVRHKGTFLGLKEKIPYLKELGINQVKLMPIYEFEECPLPAGVKAEYMRETDLHTRRNCWGYGGEATANYFAPKQSYAATKDPIRECKDMIKAFHENGIEVLLDFYFPEETGLRRIMDCLLYWICEYHIDGFQIFGAEEIGRLIATDTVLAGTKILNSYFPEEGILKKARPYKNCAEINDGFLSDMRKILKGDEGVLETFAWRARRNPAPFAVVNYITNHDGFTLHDLVSYDHKHNEENGERNEDGSAYNFSWNCGAEGETKKKNVLKMRSRQMKNAILLMMLSQGVPMLVAGDEFGNSQNGNNNPYCLDNETSWVSWNRAGRESAFTEFVKKAILFRKEHKALCNAGGLKMNDYKSCGYPDLSYHSSRAWYGNFEYDSRHLGMLYCGQYVGEEDFLYVAYNFHPLAQELALPKLPEGAKWFKVIDTSLEESFPAEEIAIPEKTRLMEVPARSIIVLEGREARKKDESDRTF